MKPFKITERAIRTWVGDRSFSRGQQYHKQGAVTSPWQQGDILKAKCWGSTPQPYHIWVQVTPDGIESGTCSCPVGADGRCKHVAALLLCWLHEPDSFQEVEPLEKVLHRREKDDLILLIRQMIARQPDLEEMVYLAPPTTPDSPAVINPDLIRRQVEQSLRHGDYGHEYYGAAQAIAHELLAILQQGDVYGERGDWANASIIYRTVLAELQGQRHQIYDHDGDLGSVFWQGSAKLGTCLQEIEQAESRLDILRVLVAIVLEDIKVGGYGFADEAYDIVLTQATAVEKVEIVTWVEAELVKVGSGDDFSSKWRMEAYGRFLLSLQADTLNDEQTIQLCRRTGQLQALVERLLQMGRVDEAVADAKKASDYELLTLADLFLAHGQATIAEGLIWERAGTSKDTRLDGWLKTQAIASGDWRKAIQYAENQFWSRPNLEQYQEVKSIAQKLGDWPERQKAMLLRLNQKEDYHLLTQIHLLENDVAAALTTLPKVRYNNALAIDVARAAEDSHPHDSIRLYRQHAEGLIAARGRDNYAQAAALLVRVKALYKKLQDPEAWQQYIQNIRDQKPRLPALLQELKGAGL